MDSFLLNDGREAGIFVLSNSSGHTVKITNFGGIIHSWETPDRHGEVGDVLLGCPEWKDYSGKHPYFGAIVGRYANRIGNARFQLNGREIALSANFPPHMLHGGFSGFDKKLWTTEKTETNGEDVLLLSTISEDGEEGFPGRLEVAVEYRLTQNGALWIQYRAVSDKDTHINLTSHPYFNLSAGRHPNVLQHRVRILADKVTETDGDIIPTGKLRNVEGSPLDFRTSTSIGHRLFEKEASMSIARGYDHNYILNHHDLDHPVAWVEEPHSGRRLRVFTDQPGIQLYTGNWLEGEPGKNGTYAQYAGFCLETQHFPDSPNHSHFPSTLLREGEVWTSKTCYAIDVMP
jgi:aldose 1-epimerase